MMDSNGFDLWADDYDKSVNLNEENNDYPFAGYKDVLNFIYKKVRQKESAEVLDIGFGTGVLTTKLYNDGYKIYGMDFSSKMISIAKKKMSEAILINWDFNRGLPYEITDHHFDFIISTYAIHHLKGDAKLNFIKSLAPHLYKDGKIIIGDVSFETRDELEKCKAKYIDCWDNDEDYFAAEEILKYFNDKYICNYKKISHCAGILTISNK